MEKDGSCNMKLKIVFAALIVFSLTRPVFSQAGKREELQKAVQRLEKQIAEVRGLPFKNPVIAKVIPRPADAPKGVQGYYSLAEKALFVYDDIAGNYERGVLIHEMVHAWQDQHFGLAKLHQGSFGSDAELALAALIEGDATFTMIETLKKDQPAVAKMLDAPLEKAKNPRNAFLYGQGARYVKALKDRGGWAAVNAAYKNPPKTTAAILFPGTFRSTIHLGPGQSKGAFGIIEKLATHPQTASVAIESACGWIGDRLVEDKDAQAWIVAFSTPEQARKFQQASAQLRKALSPKHTILSDGPNGQILQEADGIVHANLFSETRVWLMKATTPKQLQDMRDRLESPPLGVWSYPDKRFLSFGQFIDKLSDADLICVGENHDSELHHHVQLRVIKGLFANDERLGVGMEMFQRPFQKTLDAYIRGESVEDAFLKDSEYRQCWGVDWSLYRPIIEFSRKNRIPVAALNVPRELTQWLSQVGHANLTDEEKTQLGEIDFNVKAHRDYWFERLGKMHGKVELPQEQKERSYQVMTAWDSFMAGSRRGALTAAAGRKAGVDRSLEPGQSSPIQRLPRGLPVACEVSRSSEQHRMNVRRWTDRPAGQSLGESPLPGQSLYFSRPMTECSYRFRFSTRSLNFAWISVGCGLPEMITLQKFWLSCQKRQLATQTA